MSELIIKGQKAKEASYVLMNATTTEKNNALLKMAEVLLKNSKEILEANQKDLENAIEKGTPKAMLDRLALDEGRIGVLNNHPIVLTEEYEPKQGVLLPFSHTCPR